MQKHFPVGTAQAKVLMALGLTAENFDHANAIFAAHGISVSSTRVGRTTEPVISLAAEVGGGFNAWSEGETWEIPHTEIDLTPVLGWIVASDQDAAQARIRRFQAAQTKTTDTTPADGGDTGEERRTLLSETAPMRDAGPDSVSGYQDGTYMTSWRGEDGWYSCLSGQHEGNYFESDDLGPYVSRAEAEEAARDGYETHQHIGEEEYDYGWRDAAESYD